MTKHILIIDDEEHIRQMMRLTLEAGGYSVGDARDGQEGLKLYGDGSAWDAVVLDQRMPGMDGLETLQKLKAANLGVRVIMATAYASIELAVDAMKLGASDFVRKPMTPETLRNSVAAALTKKVQRPNESDRSRQDTATPGVIETITMNGFTILDVPEAASQAPNQRRFLVGAPEGASQEVVVEIDDAPVGYVERLTRRRLPPESSFWTEEARDLLSDYLWSEGKLPEKRRLVLSDLDPDMLPIAERWPED
jgi:CheY-like chemotaxis protein